MIAHIYLKNTGLRKCYIKILCIKLHEKSMTMLNLTASTKQDRSLYRAPLQKKSTSFHLVLIELNVKQTLNGQAFGQLLQSSVIDRLGTFLELYSSVCANR